MLCFCICDIQIKETTKAKLSVIQNFIVCVVNVENFGIVSVRLSKFLHFVADDNTPELCKETMRNYLKY